MENEYCGCAMDNLRYPTPIKSHILMSTEIYASECFIFGRKVIRHFFRYDIINTRINREVNTTRKTWSGFNLGLNNRENLERAFNFFNDNLTNILIIHYECTS